MVNTPRNYKKAGFAVFGTNEIGELFMLVTLSPFGRIGLPKGKIEIGELPLQAAIRETREETGFEIEKLPNSDFGKIIVKDSNSNDGKYYSIFYYIHIGKLPEVILNNRVEINSAEVSCAWFENVKNLANADETTILTKKFIANYYKKIRPIEI